MDLDKFDETMRNIKDMSPDDKKKKMSTFMDKCSCPTCPTYTECSKDDQEGIFCLMGNSFRCINEVKGCMCPGCTVENELTMKDNMYCMRGSEFENRYMDGMR